MSETQTVTANSSASQEQALDLRIIERVTAELPLVKSALVVVEDGYSRLRNSNSLSRSTFFLAEKYFSLLVLTTKPIVSTLNKPIEYADTLACVGLDKLETAVPSIRKTPDVIYGELKEYTNEKVNFARDFGLQTVQPYLKLADKGLNNAITIANSWLPAGGDMDVPQNANSLVRTKALTKKIAYLLETETTKTLIAAKRLVTESSLGQLPSRSYEMGSKLVSDMGERMKQRVVSGLENMKWLWQEVNKEETVEEKNDKSIKGTGLRFLRSGVFMTKYVHSKLPASVQEQLKESLEYGNRLYQELSKAQSIKDGIAIVSSHVSAALQNARTWLASKVPLANRYLVKSVKAQ